jgi:hypothetical protein
VGTDHARHGRSVYGLSSVYVTLCQNVVIVVFSNGVLLGRRLLACYAFTDNANRHGYCAVCSSVTTSPLAWEPVVSEVHGQIISLPQELSIDRLSMRPR